MNTDKNHLSIQLRLNGFSFCILNKTTNAITAYDDLEIKASSITPEKQLDQLRGAFDSTSVLQQEFDSIYITHSNKLSTLVPTAFFNKDHLGDYLQYNVKLLNNDFIAYDHLDSTEMVNVYIPFVYLNNFLFDKFGSFEFKHSSSVLVELLLKANKNSRQTKYYVNVEDKLFQIVIIKDKKLLYYNSFSFKSKEDFIYFILFAAEQVQLNPEELQLEFLGNIEENSELYAITFKYIRSISFFNSEFRTSPGLLKHSNLVLLNQY